jgi:hypothetical protein
VGLRVGAWGHGSKPEALLLAAKYRLSGGSGKDRGNCEREKSTSMRPRKLPSPALVLSVLALFVAFTGGAVAAVKITGKQVKDGSITGKDIKNDSLTGTDIKGQVEGPTGPRGATGPAGPAAPAASAGRVTYRSANAPVAPGGDTVSVSCPDGMVPTGGGVFVLTGDVTVDWERPAALRPGDDVPDSWQASVFNPNGEIVAVTLTVICVAAPGVVTDDSPT